MISKYYKCEFLSDIVLPASSNTQGNILLSDFIAGSNFLGMVAADGGYESFKDESFDVFHSGAVSFGDAHLTVDDKESFKIPLSYHKLKVGDEYYNRLHLSDDKEEELRKQQKQLKHIRTGFMNEDLHYQIPSYNYSQKSKYSKEYRRSEDSGMYGYSALASGTEWILKIEYRDEKYIERVEKRLLGKKKLGKSKSSQYGQVKISSTESPKKIASFIPKENLTYLYLNARAVLYENDGSATAIPTIENLSLEGGEILWEKSFIKTSTYTPYNYARQTKEYTRVCINKGSIITIKDLKGELPSRIGAFRSEGFGEIIVNPKFLKIETPMLQKFVNKTEPILSEGYDKNLLSFIEKKEQNEQEKFAVASHVQEVYEKLIGPSKSQWGEIRSLCTVAKEKDALKSSIEEYISKGIAKEQWETKKSLLLAEIDKSVAPLAFTKLLCMIVSKHTKGGSDEK